MRVERGTGTLDDLRQRIVERVQDVASRRVVASPEFHRDILVAPRAVSRRHDRCNRISVVFEGIDLRLVGLVAFIAAHALFGMNTSFPVLDERRGRLAVTIDTLFRTRRHGDVRLLEPGLLRPPRRFHPLDEDKGHEECKAENGDDDSFEIEAHKSVFSIDSINMIFGRTEEFSVRRPPPRQ
jgi:hypothetical protein